MTAAAILGFWRRTPPLPTICRTLMQQVPFPDWLRAPDVVLWIARLAPMHDADSMAVSANSVSTMGSRAQTSERKSHWLDSEGFSDPPCNVEQYVADLRRYDKLLAVRDSVSGALDYLRDGPNRRQDVASIRALLEVMQDDAHVMAKVKKLLAETSAMEDTK
ncbi:g8780 [Coccomyxa viridis]|uniref:G8780 protein n=1 Tax=Coccomyxa viridis TaxID=1274662 RepID=A0ABP1G5P1_9CHLO